MKQIHGKNGSISINGGEPFTIDSWMMEVQGQEWVDGIEAEPGVLVPKDKGIIVDEPIHMLTLPIKRRPLLDRIRKAPGLWLIYYRAFGDAGSWWGRAWLALRMTRLLFIRLEERTSMIYWQYLKSLLRHKWYVFKAGRLLKVPFWRLIIHDWTKFLPIEFINYAQWHFGKKNKRGWAKAWGHHQNHNPHHPEHWLLSWRGAPDFYDGIGKHVSEGVVVLPMPMTYVREMVADWMGASREYTGSWDMAAWLNKEGNRMRLHDETVILLNMVLNEIGYKDHESTGDGTLTWMRES
jgi:hypothetical protein